MHGFAMGVPPPRVGRVRADRACEGDEVPEEALVDAEHVARFLPVEGEYDVAELWVCVDSGLCRADPGFMDGDEEEAGVGAENTGGVPMPRKVRFVMQTWHFLRDYLSPPSLFACMRGCRALLAEEGAEVSRVRACLASLVDIGALEVHRGELFSVGARCQVTAAASRGRRVFPSSKGSAVGYAAAARPVPHCVEVAVAGRRLELRAHDYTGRLFDSRVLTK